MCGTSHLNYTQFPEIKKKKGGLKKINSPRCLCAPIDPIILSDFSFFFPTSYFEYFPREEVCKNKTFTIYEVHTQTYTMIYIMYTEQLQVRNRQESCTRRICLFFKQNKTVIEKKKKRTETKFQKRKKPKQNTQCCRARPKHIA